MFNTHTPVLLNEVIDALQIDPEGIYIDGTFGRGGHSKAILQHLNHDGKLLAIDKDPMAVKWGLEHWGTDSRFAIERGSFAQINDFMQLRTWLGKVNGILLDLGMSSPQLDEAERGFSFMKNGPLDMRMDPEAGISAAEWINSANQEKIAAVLKEYGEERFAKRIAAAIVVERAKQPIATTGQLSKIIAEANPRWEKHKHPATRSFQALRIFINQELPELSACLEQCLQALKIGGRLAVISFHSLEDRIVKRFIRRYARGDEFPIDLPITHAQLNPKLKPVGSAIYPCVKEINNNPRSRSAILRIAEKLS